MTIHDVEARMWVRSCAPIFPVRNVAIAVLHYQRLGFAVTTYGDADDDERIYAFLTTINGHEIHLTRVIDLDPRLNTSAAYLRVNDADAVFRDWSAAASGEVIPPEDKPWGMREMAYIDIDGNLLRVGHPVRGAA